MRNFLALSSLTLAALLAGCSSAQLYQSGQNWQRNECGKLDGVARERCMKSASTSYDSYRQQAERVNSPAP